MKMWFATPLQKTRLVVGVQQCAPRVLARGGLQSWPPFLVLVGNRPHVLACSAGAAVVEQGAGLATHFCVLCTALRSQCELTG